MSQAIVHLLDSAVLSGPNFPDLPQKINISERFLQKDEQLLARAIIAACVKAGNWRVLSYGEIFAEVSNLTPQKRDELSRTIVLLIKEGRLGLARLSKEGPQLVMVRGSFLRMALGLGT